MVRIIFVIFLFRWVVLFVCVSLVWVFFFFLGRLDQLFSILQSFLESLELVFCVLLFEDLCFLVWSFYVVYFKKLDLSGNDLFGSQLVFFQGLLQVLVVILLYLELIECQFVDIQLLVILFILIWCISFWYFGFYGNLLFMVGFKELLWDLVVQVELCIVVYFFFVDCYEGLFWLLFVFVLLEVFINEEKFVCVEVELYQLFLVLGCVYVFWIMDIYG